MLRLESNNTLPFFDVLLIRNIDKLEFRVYHKPTGKNHHILFYSHHNTNSKRGVIIGFYLKAQHICSSKYLNDEFNYLENSFLNLLYPKLSLHFAISKALKINNKNQPQTNVNIPSDKINLPHAHITLPNSSFSNIIGNNLNKLDVKTATLSSKTIHDLLHSSPQHDIISNAGVYCIT